MKTLTAPAMRASEQEGSAPTTQHGAPVRSEAFLVACVIALISGPHGSLGLLADDQIRDRVMQYRFSYDNHEVLCWQWYTRPAEWPLRWEKARELAARAYPELGDVNALPVYYQAAEYFVTARPAPQD
jgi:hypothetical protein